jgi:hypothetical protein
MDNGKLLKAANDAAITHILPYEMDYSIEQNSQGFLVEVKDKNSSWELLDQINLLGLPDFVKEQYVICKIHAITVKIINKKFPL